MLKVKRSDLLGVLGHLASITANKDKGVIRFDVFPHGFAITADNGEQRMREARALTAETDVESWTCYLEARNLFRAVRAIDADVVSFKLNTRNGRLSVLGGNADFTLNTHGEAGSNFPPDMPQEEGLLSKVKASVLRDALSAVLPSVSDDANRYGLNGVFVEWLPKHGGQGARVVSTDGSRLFYVGFGVEEGELRLNGKTLLPREAVTTILAIEGGSEEVVEISIGSNAATFYWPSSDIRLLSQLVDGVFPDYRQVIGAETRRSGELYLDTKMLIDGLTKAEIMIDGPGKVVRMSIFPDMIHLSAVSHKSGDALVKVEASYTGQPGMVIGFNAKYLADAAKSCRTDTVRLTFDKPLYPVFITANHGDGPDVKGTLGVVMPVRLD